MTSDQRLAAVAEARTWLGTPYHACADVKGVGVDCAMLLIRVYTAVGAIPADYDPRPYSPEWHLHQHEELYLGGLERFARRVERAEPGDVITYRFGKAVGHGAIVVDDDYIIHAHLKHGNVELAERRTYAHRLDSIWSLA
jgi:NlpC/P60 family putative phage cell wall peptidase